MTRTFRNVVSDPPTLAAGVSIGATTATLSTDPGSEMPTTGPFTVVIDTEVFTNCSRSGTTLNLGGMATAAHSSGASVVHVFGRTDAEAMVQTDDDRLKHRKLEPVLAMADSNINIASAPASIDGLTDAGRYLLYAQTTPEQVGIYDWNGSAGSTLARATDCASGIPAGGLETYVLGGTYALSTRINRNSGTVGDGADQWDEPYFNSLAAATINGDSASFTAATIGGLDIVGYYSQSTAADTTSSSTTITQIITMGDGVTPIPMGTYDIEAYIQFQSSNAANGISFRIGSPLSMDWTNYGWHTNCGATNANGTVKSNYATVTLDAVTTANTDYWVKISGSVAFTSNLSNFYLGIAREHATLHQTTVYKGTKMILRPTTI